MKWYINPTPDYNDLVMMPPFEVAWDVQLRIRRMAVKGGQ